MTARQIGDGKPSNSSVGRLRKKEEEQKNRRIDPVAVASNRCLRRPFSTLIDVVSKDM
jgi:hypothetical protein